MVYRIKNGKNEKALKIILQDRRPKEPEIPTIDLLLNGFSQAITPMNLLFALIGPVLGTLVGVLPGIGPTSGIAILLLLTSFLSKNSGNSCRRSIKDT